ncbi:hypothetical protein ALO97_05290 [Pseudomonas syringae pv. tagetis]|uniref:Uncharacterized protein n=2 Tax=Pseudomonas syringae pv. tagetis TaxID=129140 RepID=A0A0Q0ARG8_9PSED|nr:Uncharacterized protein ALO44_05561 [Pseudomonas syringae pv. tagetis]RMW12032.1 hypothetical protein ALO98_05162 [Pseudomonas syringae pv. tagetis]RMW20237.1 hypothetical protein ALO97_05290 [Pseudomonas syringae pv. tagetis]
MGDRFYLRSLRPGGGCRYQPSRWLACSFAAAVSEHAACPGVPPCLTRLGYYIVMSYPDRLHDIVSIHSLRPAVMNHIWSPLRQDTLFHPSSFLLEQPSILLPEYSSNRHDTLNASVPFALPALQLAPREHPLPPTEEHEPQAPAAHIERPLKALRKSPGFPLIADSVLLLKACQLDMDLPPNRRHHVRQQLVALLTQRTGKALDPDTLGVTFSTQTLPALNDEGHESYSIELSLTDVALSATFDPGQFVRLYRSEITSTHWPEEASSLSATQLVKWISEAHLDRDYSTALEVFRTRHAATFRTLSRLGFLDVLARQFLSGHISRAGYFLTLDALGLSDFPADVATLEQSGRGQKSEIRMLSLNGDTVQGIFQVRSKATSHCFIHILGAKGNVIEYISEDPGEMTRRLLAAMNVSGLYGHALHALDQDAVIVADAPLLAGDVFTELSQASLTETQFNSENIDLLKPVSRSLTLAGAADLWQTASTLLEQIPSAPRMAAQVMAAYLLKHHNLTLNPDHVFIAYQSGNSVSPLGSPRNPPIHVHTPAEKPISLSEALISNYRVDSPEGYIDHDGTTEVFLDSTGQGERAQGQRLAITPQALEDYIKAFDFLTWMTGHIQTFWRQQKTAIEQAFRSAFINQALISLKRGSLKRNGFDQVVEALAGSAPGHWLALGFFVQGSLIDGMEHQYTGLLILKHTDKPNVLYQPGHPEAFVQFSDDSELERYLKLKTAHPDWREAVMRYVPLRHHQRLDYLFKLWGGAQPPTPPASLLRPWTDALYNPDTRKAMHHSLCEKKLEGSPFAYLHQLLEQNSLDDAKEQIVTPAQVSLAYWTDRLHQLQRLLAPISLLLTPVYFASLAAEVGLAALSVASANLPGRRYAEKHQALLATLSLGLLQLGPQTPRLLRTLTKIVKPAGHTAGVSSVSSAGARGPGRLSIRPIKPRQTRLEKFFHTDALLKRWTITGAAAPSRVAVHAWKLGGRFLLWTSDRGQARTLVVSTHGYYTPWTATVKIPNGTEIRTYAPHGYELVDPQLHRVVNGNVRPFAASSTAEHSLMQPVLEPLLMTDKVISGTSLPGRLKNYSLSKFQTPSGESYDDIARVVGNSNGSPLKGWLPPKPMDVLTVRSRFGMTPPSLNDLFNSLSAQGIHYDRILLLHCRCAAISALLRRAPVYHAPTAQSIGRSA